MLTHRRAVDRVRSVTRAPARDQRHFHLSSDAVPDVSELGIARHEAARLREVVAGLSKVQREAIALTYLDGNSHKEAALQLGIPLGTLKTRVRDGLIAMRTSLVGSVA